MNVTIFPSRARGTVTAPPSKSMAHRALICGALAGNSVVRRLAYSDDIEATLGCLRALGAGIRRQGNTVFSETFVPTKTPSGTTLFCHESGSTLRFLLPLCMSMGVPVTLTGSVRLFQRPLTVYENIAHQQHIAFTKSADHVTVCGRLSAGDYVVPGNISSQFISGLLFVLPLLDGDSTITITDGFESESYVTMTTAMQEVFGVTIHRHNSTFIIPGNQRYQRGDYTVEGDCSNAAFLDGLNLLGGQVTVEGLCPHTLQGDSVYKEIFAAMVAEKRHFDLSNCPDLAPVLFALAAARGGATFTGTARLRLKESDRGVAMAMELAKFGAEVTVEESAVTVHPCALHPPAETLWGHNDHRIVMALSLLCTLTGGIINGAEAVQKSYPDFFERLHSLQIELEYHET